MKTFALIALFFALAPFAMQAGEFVLIQEYNGITGFVAEDRLGNIYSIENGVLYKNPRLPEEISYSKRSFGRISSVHVEDPLNLYVFFEDFGHVVMLDKNLAEKSVLLSPVLHPDDLAQKICYSAQDGFWAFFPNDTRIVRFNRRGIPEMKSNPLYEDFPALNNVQHMQESDRHLFLSQQGLWAFDLHGGFLFYLPDVEPEVFQVMGQKVFFIKDGYLSVYDFFLREETLILLPEDEVNSFFVKGNEIYLQTEKAVKKFRYTENFW